MIGQTIRQTPIFNDLKGLARVEVCVSRCKSVSVCKVCALKYASRRDSKICRPTADRHSICSVLNKTAPPVHGADGTQSIRTRLNPAKHYQAAKNQTDSRCQNASRTGHCNFAYSALASFKMGMSGSEGKASESYGNCRSSA